MVMVYISRHGAKFRAGVGDGDKIKWKIGEPVVFHSSGGQTYHVRVASNFVLHEADPSKRCIEVIDDDGNRYCVLAERVVPVGGFPPARGLPYEK